MNNNIFLEIVRATYVEDYKLHVVFNNGIEKIVDFYDLLFNHNYPAFISLRDIQLFRQLKITDTIEWGNGTIDIAPETVYEMGETIKTDSVAEPKAKYRPQSDKT